MNTSVRSLWFVIVLGVLATTGILPRPASAASVNVTLDRKQLGDGKNSVYYFKSGGILFGFMDHGEFNKFSLETNTQRPVAMSAVGEASTTEHAPAGSADKLCTQWRSRCWDSAAVQISVCSATCIQRKDEKTGEVKPVTADQNIYLTIASDVVQLN